MAQHLQPEQQAREQIDKMLEAAGWVVQDFAEIDLTPRGVAVREVKMKRGHGRADYLLFVDRKAVGALEAKRVGETLSGVVLQAKMYSEGLPTQLNAPVRPLPFMYVSTGVETLFMNRLDPDPRSRRVFAVHRPETLARWLKSDNLYKWAAGWADRRPGIAADDSDRPSTLRSRLQKLPEPVIPGLWPNQVEAITKLERSLADNKPRALIQMATGSGKSKTAVAAIAPVAERMIEAAVNPLASQSKLRDLLRDLKKQFEQIIDDSTVDVLLFAGPSAEAKDRAKALTQSFEQFLEDHKDEIDALQFFYSKPYKERLSFNDIQGLADSIQAPPRQWTTERLWQAYERLDESKVKGAGGERLLTDVVSLVRYALHRDEELVPYADRVRERYEKGLISLMRSTAQRQNSWPIAPKPAIRATA